jgi:hypothetical protein
LYFSDSDIEVQFRFPCVDSIATLFSIFEQNMAIDYNQELNHKSISNKKNNKKKSNVKDSFLMNITKIKAAIDEFNQKTSFFNIINNWDTFRRLSEVL